MQLAHQTPNAGQTQPQATRRRISVLCRASNIFDPGSLIARDDLNTLLIAYLKVLKDDLAFAGILEDVASRL